MYESVTQTYEDDLRGQTVCVALDGWSNYHNEPIAGITIFCKGQTYLVDSIDASGTHGCSEHIFNLLSKDIKTSNVKVQVVDIVKIFPK